MIKHGGSSLVSASSPFVCLQCRFRSRLQQLQRPARQFSRRAVAPSPPTALDRNPARYDASTGRLALSNNSASQTHARHTSTVTKKRRTAAARLAKAAATPDASVSNGSTHNEESPDDTASGTPSDPGTPKVNKKAKSNDEGVEAAEILNSLPAPVPKVSKAAAQRSKRQELRLRQRLTSRVTSTPKLISKFKSTPKLIRNFISGGSKDAQPLSPNKPSKKTSGPPTIRQIRTGLSEDEGVVNEVAQGPGPLRGQSLKSALTSAQVDQHWPSLTGSELKLGVIEAEQPPVPSLSRGLDRVLFNAGVHRVRDPHTRVYNFDPDLEKLMPVNEFDFNTLRPFMPPSKDAFLTQIATKQKKKYVGSTSSMTGMLKHFHYLLSNWRDIRTDMLSRTIRDNLKSFTKLNRGPDAIFLRWKNGTYAVDADKEFDSANVLSLMGKYMELLLTETKETFEKRRIGKSHLLTKDDRSGADSFHYSTLGNFVIRSQLDTYDKRLPGTGMFDLKTRAVLPIRMDTKNFQWGMGYEIRHLQGEWASFEREYYDMIRSTMLKYSLQVRMGRMDGIFVAYHNITRIFGFQYISLEEMDYALHGQSNRALGDQEFLLSLSLLNKAFDRAIKKFPGQTLRFHFETREGVTPFMYIFAEPVTDEEADAIQNKNKKEIEEWERDLLGKQPDDARVAEAAGAAAVEAVTSSPSVHLEEEATASVHEEATASVSEDVTPNIPEEAIVDISGETTNVEDATTDIPEEVTASVQEDANTDTPEEAIVDISKETTNAEEGTLIIGSTDTELALVDSLVDEPERLLETDSTAAVSDGDAAKLVEDGPYESTTDADAEFLASLPEEGTEAPKSLLAMMLTIKSKQNDDYVNRPIDLSDSDTWKMKYSLTEIQKPERAHSLYLACKARRHKLMANLKDKEEEPDAHYEQFINVLKEKAEQGRAWRKEMDDLEAAEARGSVQANMVDMSESTNNIRVHGERSTAPPPAANMPVDERAGGASMDDYLSMLYGEHGDGETPPVEDGR